MRVKITMFYIPPQSPKINELIELEAIEEI
jgi:hypothetical protein